LWEAIDPDKDFRRSSTMNEYFDFGNFIHRSSEALIFLLVEISASPFMNRIYV
jgi:hypothetical protein